MKMFLFILLVVSFTISGFGSDVISIYEGEGYRYNSILERFVDTSYEIIAYNDAVDVYYLCIIDYFTTGYISLSKEHLNTLRQTLNKYLEWEKLAVERKSEILKDIPNSLLKTEVAWKSGSNWHVAGNLEIKFSFFSQNPSLHQLIISSNNVVSYKNTFIEFQLEDIYLCKNNVEMLLSGISEKSIKSAIARNTEKLKEMDVFK